MYLAQQLEHCKFSVNAGYLCFILSQNPFNGQNLKPYVLIYLFHGVMGYVSVVSYRQYKENKDQFEQLTKK